ncbi:MAG: cupredoxin domain-containing protein [Hyphomicrobiaceae bacterium]
MKLKLYLLPLFLGMLWPLLIAPLQAQEARTHRVEISDFEFVPNTVRARVGDQIIFVNKDTVPHTATQTPTGWDSGTLTTGKSWSFMIQASGSLVYHCRFHPKMTASIVVQ